MDPTQPPRSDRPVPAADAAPGAPGDTITVEAATAAKALEEVTGLLGADAEIVRADKIQRGGIGGFFAKELVQLTARRKQGGSATPGSAPQEPEAPAAHAVPEPETRVTPGADPFAEALGRFLANEAGSEAAAPPLPAGPAPLQPAAAGYAPHASAPAIDDTPVRPFTPAIDDAAVRPFTPAALEAILPAVPARSAAPVPQQPQAPVPQQPQAPAAVLLDAPTTPDAPDVAEAPTVPGAPARSSKPAAAVVLDAPTAPNALDVAEAPTVPGAPARRSKPAAAPDSTGAPGTGSPDWSPEALLRLGLSVALVRPLIETPPRTDATWIHALARSVAGLCGPLSDEPALLVGPRAHLLAKPLGLPQVDYPDTPPATGSAVLALHVPTADLGLVLHLLGDRRLHLVAGGEGWERLSSLRPSVVSWAGTAALPAALALCAAHSLTLGYGCAGAGAPTFHATPLDVALAIRDLVGRR